MLIVLVAAWVVGGTRLWRTSVPGSLRVDGLDVHRQFTAAQLAESHHVSFWLDVDWVLGTLAGLVALAILAWRAPRFASRIGLGPIGSGVIVGLLTLAVLWAVALPFGVFAQWWEARHGLAPHHYLAWLAAPWATLGFEAVYALVVVVVVMALARRLGPSWWLAGGAAFVALAVGFAFLSGYVSSRGTTKPPHGLQARVHRLEAREGVSVPVSVEQVSDWTNEANAFSVGIGPSTRVVLWNTLLDGRFGRGEVDVVVAHELGHVAHHHVWKALGWAALVAFPLAFGVAVLTRPLGGLGSPAAVPLALLVVTVAALCASPVENAVSRRYEAEADWSALQATHDPEAAARLFRSFERTSLQEPSPPTWAYVLLASHPTLAQRIAMAERWAATNRGRGRAAALPAGS